MMCLDSIVLILSPVIALAAVVVGPIMASRNSKREIIAPMRQAWINSLRDRLAEFMSLLMHYAIGEASGTSRDFSSNDYKVIHKLQTSIELMLNPTEDDHKKLDVLMGEMVLAVQSQCGRMEFPDLYKRMRVLARRILKTEWNRVKEHRL